MDCDKLKSAISEAKRFIERAERAERGFVWIDSVHFPAGGYWRNNATTAAAKRASMDLTRALADMRRPS